MDERAFKDRTKQVALRIVRVVEALPHTKTADVIGRQLLRSGASFGANYRAACRGRSPADVIAKLAIVEEEAVESIYWLELLIESGTLPASRLDDLIDELNQIVATSWRSFNGAGFRATASPTERLWVQAQALECPSRQSLRIRICHRRGSTPLEGLLARRRLAA